MPTKPRFDPSQPFEVVGESPYGEGKPRFDPSQPFEPVNELPTKPGVQSALEGVSGFGSYVAGSVPFLGPAAQLAPSAIIETVAPEYAAQRTKPPYRNLVEQEKARIGEERRQYAEEHPIMAGMGGVVGAAMVPIKTSFVTPAATAGRLAKAAAEGVNVLGRAGQAGALTAADTAVTGTGDPESRGLETAALSAGAEGVIKGLGKGIPALGRVVTGVKKSTIDKYRARAPQINELTREQAIDDVAGALDKVQAPVQRSREAVKEAADVAADAKMLYRESLKEIRPPEALAPQISDDLNALRKEISAKSGEAFDTLAESGKRFKTPKLKGWLTSKINSLKLESGEIPPDLRDEVAKLEQYREFLDQVGDDISAVDMKRIVQSLDAASERAFATAAQPGGYISRGDRTLMEFRRHLDKDHLKKITEYADAMKPVSESQRLMEEVTDVFAKNDDKIAEQLKRLKPEQRRALKSLSAKTGNDYEAMLREYDEAKTILGTPSRFRTQADALPEVEQLRAAEAAAEAAAKRAEPLKGITTDRVEGLLKQFQREKGRSAITLRRKLDYLAKESGVDVKQIADDLAVKEALEQGFTHGSRNVNLGAFSVGGLARGAANVMRGSEGAVAGGVGGAIGAILGGAADLIGPQMYKRVVDASMNPSFAKYVPTLQAAAKRGPAAVAMAIDTLFKRDPEFGKLLGE